MLPSAPVGVILAGGLGRRIGGAKAVAPLRGRPLIAYPLEAMRAVLEDVAVVAKADSELPRLPGTLLWTEAAQPRHPVVGIIHALARAQGRAVLVCAADLPLVTPELIEALARADAGGAGAVLAGSRGRRQPLLGCYQPWAGALLERESSSEPERPLQMLVSALDPRWLEVEDPDALFNVNSPEDLATASAMIERRGGAGAGANRR